MRSLGRRVRNLEQIHRVDDDAELLQLYAAAADIDVRELHLAMQSTADAIRARCGSRPRQRCVTEALCEQAAEAGVVIHPGDIEAEALRLKAEVDSMLSVRSRAS